MSEVWYDQNSWDQSKSQSWTWSSFLPYSPIHPPADPLSPHLPIFVSASPDLYLSFSFFLTLRINTVDRSLFFFFRLSAFCFISWLFKKICCLKIFSLETDCSFRKMTNWQPGSKTGRRGMTDRRKKMEKSLKESSDRKREGEGRSVRFLCDFFFSKFVVVSIYGFIYINGTTLR